MTLQPIGVTFEYGIKFTKADILDAQRLSGAAARGARVVEEALVDDPAATFTHQMHVGHFWALVD